MASDAVLFAGACITSGRRPITFAALDEKLDVILLTQWDIPQVIGCLLEYEIIQLAIDSPNSKTGRGVYQSFQEKILEAGFKHYSRKDSSRLWIESNADQCYRVFQADLFPRRSLEGRLQRALILYEEGLQLPDPMDFFEEITRHKLLQGTLPTENMYSSKELDALVMAYISWMAGDPSQKVVIKGDLYLPAPE